MSLFKTVGITGRHRSYNIANTLEELLSFLENRGISIYLDQETAKLLPSLKQSIHVCSHHQLGAVSDLVIVVGGDGCFLNAARNIVNHGTPIIGINRGRLGFLTDVSPAELVIKLQEVLDGHYQAEQRFLLHCDVIDDDDTMIADGLALNEVVLLPGNVSQMIEFDVYVDNAHVCRHRADGIIVTTPTGSTAYALSGGGPILHPHLDAIALVPMFPHTLSNRPIVVAGTSTIELIITQDNKVTPRLSCDGQARIPVPPNARVKIKKFPTLLNLLHPQSYEFFATLRSKLGWLTKFNTNTGS